jgi:preprotein translocase subunit SecE
MGVSVETSNGMPDQVKWLTAAALLAGAVVAFYYFGDRSLLLRVIGLIVVGGIAAAVAFQTDKGREAWEFMRDSRIELRKVVWPTRKETMQTTLIVIAVVALTAVMLWLLDGLLAWIVRLLLGQGG